ncbi:protein-tyrosine phosphatase domain-containing protein [Ditylenchus destructor]|nr:protein-tyrosine phosphatase domain-containing protein [Ditylenchus destructor]
MFSWGNNGAIAPADCIFSGRAAVTLLDTTELAHYCTRVLRIEDLRTKEYRQIQHAQFTAWPDHGVPNHPTPFLMFLKRIKSLNPPDAVDAQLLRIAALALAELERI